MPMEALPLEDLAQAMVHGGVALVLEVTPCPMVTVEPTSVLVQEALLPGLHSVPTMVTGSVLHATLVMICKVRNATIASAGVLMVRLLKGLLVPSTKVRSVSVAVLVIL